MDHLCIFIADNTCEASVNKNAEIDNIMSGYYFGTVDLKKIGDSKLQRIII